jgi:hypothetical protein
VKSRKKAEQNRFCSAFSRIFPPVVPLISTWPDRTTSTPRARGIFHLHRTSPANVPLRKHLRAAHRRQPSNFTDSSHVILPFFSIFCILNFAFLIVVPSSHPPMDKECPTHRKIPGKKSNESGLLKILSGTMTR